MQECYLTKACFCEPKHTLTQCSNSVLWVSGVIVKLQEKKMRNIRLECWFLKIHPNLYLQRCVQGRWAPLYRQSGGTGPWLSLLTVPPVSSHHVTTPQAPRRAAARC